jgi:SAM domain (Sterile alpha motif)
LAEHIELFRAEKIDAAVVPTLTDGDLRELGLPLGDRKNCVRPSTRSARRTPPALSRCRRRHGPLPNNAI